ncbi:Bug family tripartite tricarboxylate transporter substrate binding protein [Limnohabitans sp.]|uniref:Bug family tripartite tricarboxylate transporter substrate binding protein n=1 Tax=Limnohabitans sp. TaxID=1907725 RepID=UPI0038BE0880
MVRCFMTRCLLALSLGSSLWMALPAQAQSTAYPARPVKFIVPITPGGSNDVVARVIAQKLTEQWGQAVTVDNRPGAGMNLGADLVAKSAPDGYTWLLGANNIFVTNPHVGKTPFDVFKDFTPISQVALVPFVLVVHPSVPAKNVAELVAYAKANPDKLNYGSSGNGSPQQLASEMLNHAAGIQMQHVPYKGAVPAITDLLGGRIQVFIGAINSLLPHIKEGKLRLIAGAGGKRFAAFPDVPAMAETVPGVALDVWLGVFMPAGVPKEMVTKVNADIARVLQLPDVKANLNGQGIEAAPSSPEALAATIKDDYARWGKVIREANIKAD